MIPDDDQIRALVARPGESLNVEIKRWLDPADPVAAAKIVKAVFALRNRNGGFLVIGFDDKTLEPDMTNAPPDVRGAFHQDRGGDDHSAEACGDAPVPLMRSGVQSA